MSYRIEGKDIVISGFENGISDNPYKGISDMRNVNNSSVDGEASVAFALTKSSLNSVSGSVVSADDTTDIVTFGTLTGTLANYTAVVFTGASLPTGITAGIVYYLGSVSGVTDKLYTRGDLTVGSLVNITATGTGTFASINMTKVNHFAIKTTTTSGLPTYTYFALDSSGRAWTYYTTAGSWVFLGNLITGNNPDTGSAIEGAYGNGLGWYRGYLFVWRSAELDYLPTSDIFDSTKWKYAWSPATGTPTGAISNLGAPNSAFSHETLVGIIS